MHIRIEPYEQIALMDKLLTFLGAHTTFIGLVSSVNVNFCFNEGDVVDKGIHRNIPKFIQNIVKFT